MAAPLFCRFSRICHIYWGKSRTLNAIRFSSIIQERQLSGRHQENSHSGRNVSCGRHRKRLFLAVAAGIGFGVAVVETLKRHNILHLGSLSDLCRSVPVVEAAHLVTDLDHLKVKKEQPRNRYNFIADVVEKASPAVVFIEIKGR